MICLIHFQYIIAVDLWSRLNHFQFHMVTWHYWQSIKQLIPVNLRLVNDIVIACVRWACLKVERYKALVKFFILMQLCVFALCNKTLLTKNNTVVFSFMNVQKVFTFCFFISACFLVPWLWYQNVYILYRLIKVFLSV